MNLSFANEIDYFTVDAIGTAACYPYFLWSIPLESWRLVIKSKKNMFENLSDWRIYKLTFLFLKSQNINWFFQSKSDLHILGPEQEPRLLQHEQSHRPGSGSSHNHSQNPGPGHYGQSPGLHNSWVTRLVDLVEIPVWQYPQKEASIPSQG